MLFSFLPSVALAHTENSEGYSKIIQDSDSLRSFDGNLYAFTPKK